ncbi:MAG: threonylcarbamoyl-AMP synthase [Balneolales bacterium]|nr:threonylcarbamoyl-AMP synthase [Balneolales bacterium]
MADKIKLHPVTPHVKRVFEIVDRLRAGEIMLFPSDTRYALGCDYTQKRGIDKIRNIRKLDDDHLFTLICDSLNGISRFATLTDENFKMIKRLIPGPYTFVLPATKEVPRLLLHPKRKTVGFRVPDHPICEKIVSELGHPLLATSAKLPDEMYVGGNPEFPDDLFKMFESFVDIVVDDEQPLREDNSTIIDMTGDVPVLLRKGEGFDKVEEVFLLHNYQPEIV